MDLLGVFWCVFGVFCCWWLWDTLCAAQKIKTRQWEYLWESGAGLFVSLRRKLRALANLTRSARLIHINILCAVSRAYASGGWVLVMENKVLHTTAGFNDHIGQCLLGGRVIAFHVEQRQRRELCSRAAWHQFETFTFRVVPLVHYFLQMGTKQKKLEVSQREWQLLWRKVSISLWLLKAYP